MAWRASGESNEELARNLRVQCECSEAVERAFKNVDRANFLPEEVKGAAYLDQPVRHRSDRGVVFHMSAPHIYATVLDELELEDGNSFLCVGSGTGYLNTLVASMVGHSAPNHGVELDPGLVRWARQRTALAQALHIEFEQGDAFFIDNDARKYDRIWVSAACHFTRCRHNFVNLLNPGGILLMPLEHTLVKWRRAADGSASSSDIADVRFAPMVEPNPFEQDFMPPVSVTSELDKIGATRDVYRRSIKYGGSSYSGSLTQLAVID